MGEKHEDDKHGQERPREDDKLQGEALAQEQQRDDDVSPAVHVKGDSAAPEVAGDGTREDKKRQRPRVLPTITGESVESIPTHEEARERIWQAHGYHQAGDVPDFRENFKLVEEALPLELDTQAVTKWVDALVEQHLLVLNSYDVQVLFTAQHCIAARLEERFATVQVLQPARHPSEISFEAELGRPNHSSSELTILSADTEHAGLFVSQMKAALTPTGQVQIRETLRLKQSWFLVLVCTEHFELIGESCDFHHRPIEIDFLRPRLRRFFEGGAQEKEAEIRRQQQTPGGMAFWGESRIDFFRNFRRLGSASQVESAIEAVRNADAREERVGDDTDATSKRPWLHSPHREVLYVAVYFRNLRLGDFDGVVKALLRDRRAETEIDEEGHRRLQKKNEEARRLVDLWGEERAAILESCQIQSVPIDGLQARGASTSLLGAPKTLDFRRSALRQQFAEQLELADPLIHSTYFSFLTNSGIFFTSSDELMFQLVRYFCGVATAHPEQLEAAWLLSLVLRAGPPVDLRSDKTRTSREEQLHQLLSSLAEGQRQLVLDRVFYLMRGLRDVVGATLLIDSFMSMLIDLRLHTYAISLASRLCWLSSSSNDRSAVSWSTEVLKWFRKILALTEPDTEGWNQALAELFRLITPNVNGALRLECVLAWADSESAQPSDVRVRNQIVRIFLDELILEGLDLANKARDLPVPLLAV